MRPLNRISSSASLPPVVRGGDPAKIADYADPLDPYPFDAVCTNRIDLWQESLGE